MSKVRYQARCHCGALRFAFRSEPFEEARRCNCSICVRKGALMSAQYIPAEDFEPLDEAAAVSDYRWGDGDVNHLFCPACGIYPYHGDEKVGYRVNLGCVEGLDVFALEVSIIDGRSM